MAVKQLEDAFGFLLTSQRAWLNVLGLGANDVIRGTIVIAATGIVVK